MKAAPKLAGEPKVIECRLANGGGTSTRMAELVGVKGWSLLGPPTIFPVWRPQISKGERAVWRRGAWWIVTRRSRGRRILQR